MQALFPEAYQLELTRLLEGLHDRLHAEGHPTVVLPIDPTVFTSRASSSIKQLSPGRSEQEDGHGLLPNDSRVPSHNPSGSTSLPLATSACSSPQMSVELKPPGATMPSIVRDQGMKAADLEEDVPIVPDCLRPYIPPSKLTDESFLRGILPTSPSTSAIRRQPSTSASSSSTVSLKHPHSLITPTNQTHSRISPKACTSSPPSTMPRLPFASLFSPSVMDHTAHYITTVTRQKTSSPPSRFSSNPPLFLSPPLTLSSAPTDPVVGPQHTFAPACPTSFTEPPLMLLGGNDNDSDDDTELDRLAGTLGTRRLSIRRASVTLHLPFAEQDQGGSLDSTMPTSNNASSQPGVAKQPNRRQAYIDKGARALAGMNSVVARKDQLPQPWRLVSGLVDHVIEEAWRIIGIRHGHGGGHETLNNSPRPIPNPSDQLDVGCLHLGHPSLGNTPSDPDTTTSGKSKGEKVEVSAKSHRLVSMYYGSGDSGNGSLGVLSSVSAASSMHRHRHERSQRITAMLSQPSSTRINTSSSFLSSPLTPPLTLSTSQPHSLGFTTTTTTTQSQSSMSQAPSHQSSSPYQIVSRSLPLTKPITLAQSVEARFLDALPFCPQYASLSHPHLLSSLARVRKSPHSVMHSPPNLPVTLSLPAPADPTVSKSSCPHPAPVSPHLAAVVGVATATANSFSLPSLSTCHQDTDHVSTHSALYDALSSLASPPPDTQRAVRQVPTVLVTAAGVIIVCRQDRDNGKPHHATKGKGLENLASWEAVAVALPVPTYLHLTCAVSTPLSTSTTTPIIQGQTQASQPQFSTLKQRGNSLHPSNPVTSPSPIQAAPTPASAFVSSVSTMTSLPMSSSSPPLVSNDISIPTIQPMLSLVTLSMQPIPFSASLSAATQPTPSFTTSSIARSVPHSSSLIHHSLSMSPRGSRTFKGLRREQGSISTLPTTSETALLSQTEEHPRPIPSSVTVGEMSHSLTTRHFTPSVGSQDTIMVFDDQEDSDPRSLDASSLYEDDFWLLLTTPTLLRLFRVSLGGGGPQHSQGRIWLCCALPVVHAAQIAQCTSAGSTIIPLPFATATDPTSDPVFASPHTATAQATLVKEDKSQVPGKVFDARYRPKNKPMDKEGESIGVSEKQSDKQARLIDRYDKGGKGEGSDVSGEDDVNPFGRHNEFVTDGTFNGDNEGDDDDRVSLPGGFAPSTFSSASSSAPLVISGSVHFVSSTISPDGSVLSAVLSDGATLVFSLPSVLAMSMPSASALDQHHQAQVVADINAALTQAHSHASNEARIEKLQKDIPSAGGSTVPSGVPSNPNATNALTNNNASSTNPSLQRESSLSSRTSSTVGQPLSTTQGSLVKGRAKTRVTAGQEILASPSRRPSVTGGKPPNLAFILTQLANPYAALDIDDTADGVTEGTGECDISSGNKEQHRGLSNKLSCSLFGENTGVSVIPTVPYAPMQLILSSPAPPDLTHIGATVRSTILNARSILANLVAPSQSSSQPQPLTTASPPVAACMSILSSLPLLPPSIADFLLSGCMVSTTDQSAYPSMINNLPHPQGHPPLSSQASLPLSSPTSSSSTSSVTKADPRALQASPSVPLPEFSDPNPVIAFPSSLTIQNLRLLTELTSQPSQQGSTTFIGQGGRRFSFSSLPSLSPEPRSSIPGFLASASSSMPLLPPLPPGPPSFSGSSSQSDVYSRVSQLSFISESSQAGLTPFATSSSTGSYSGSLSHSTIYPSESDLTPVTLANADVGYIRSPGVSGQAVHQLNARFRRMDSESHADGSISGVSASHVSSPSAVGFVGTSPTSSVRVSSSSPVFTPPPVAASPFALSYIASMLALFSPSNKPSPLDVLTAPSIPVPRPISLPYPSSTPSSLPFPMNGLPSLSLDQPAWTMLKAALTSTSYPLPGSALRPAPFPIGVAYITSSIPLPFGAYLNNTSISRPSTRFIPKRASTSGPTSSSRSSRMSSLSSPSTTAPLSFTPTNSTPMARSGMTTPVYRDSLSSPSSLASLSSSSSSTCFAPASNDVAPINQDANTSPWTEVFTYTSAIVRWSSTTSAIKIHLLAPPTKGLVPPTRQPTTTGSAHHVSTSSGLFAHSPSSNSLTRSTRNGTPRSSHSSSGRSHVTPTGFRPSPFDFDRNSTVEKRHLPTFNASNLDNALPLSRPPPHTPTVAASLTLALPSPATFVTTFPPQSSTSVGAYVRRSAPTPTVSTSSMASTHIPELPDDVEASITKMLVVGLVSGDIYIYTVTEGPRFQLAHVIPSVGASTAFSVKDSTQRPSHTVSQAAHGGPVDRIISTSNGHIVSICSRFHTIAIHSITTTPSLSITALGVYTFPSPALHVLSCGTSLIIATNRPSHHLQNQQPGSKQSLGISPKSQDTGRRGNQASVTPHPAASDDSIPDTPPGHTPVTLYIYSLITRAFVACVPHLSLPAYSSIATSFAVLPSPSSATPLTLPSISTPSRPVDSLLSLSLDLSAWALLARAFVSEVQAPIPGPGTPPHFTVSTESASIPCGLSCFDLASLPQLSATSSTSTSSQLRSTLQLSVSDPFTLTPQQPSRLSSATLLNNTFTRSRNLMLPSTIPNSTASSVASLPSNHPLLPPLSARRDTQSHNHLIPLNSSPYPPVPRPLGSFCARPQTVPSAFDVDAFAVTHLTRVLSQRISTTELRMNREALLQKLTTVESKSIGRSSKNNRPLTRRIPANPNR